MKGIRRFLSLALACAAIAAASLAAQKPKTASDREAFELMKEGVKRYNRKEYEAAIDFFRKSLGRNSKDSRTRYFLGMAYYKAGFDENAVFELGNLLDNAEDGDFLGQSLLGNFIRYLSSKQALLQRERKSGDYALGREFKTNSIGKYILSKCTGLDVDEEGNIYIASFGSKIAVKVSQTGKPVLAFSRYKADHGRLYDIAVWSGGKGADKLVYISDFTGDEVYKFGDDGRYIGSIGGPGYREGQLYGPTAVAVDGAGDIYVVDSGNARVQKFSPEGDFLLAFGREGEGEGDFSHPSGIAVDPEGRIYVSDHGRKTIQVYDGSGNYLGRLEGLDLEDPYGLSIAGLNRLAVADSGRVLLYDLRYSTWTEPDTGGRLGRALDVKVDRLEQLYAADFEKDSLFQFVPKADKYRNLTVILDRVDTSRFPTIGYHVSVLDADGLPIYGLEADNFSLKLGGGPTGWITVPSGGRTLLDFLAGETRNPALSIVFLADKSTSMAQYRTDVGLYIEKFLSTVPEDDRMAVIGFNADSWVSSSFTPSKRRIADSILEERYKDGKAFDKAFRRGVDYLNKEAGRKALVVVTDGNYSDQSFKTYSLLSCINYAMNNYIPVFFLNFSGRENGALSHFARSTGGRQYDVLHSSELPYLYETLRGYRSPEYLVMFNEPRDPSLSNLYLDAEVEVNFNGRFGKASLGCIYP